MSKIAIVNVAKSGGNPMLNLPADATTRRDGKLWTVEFRGHTLFAYVLKNSATRWVACVAAPKRAFVWMQNNVGTDATELTYETWQANKAQLEALGLAGELDGTEEVLRLPHVVCGQSAFLRSAV